MKVKSKLPQYKQLYEILRKHIVEGVYRENDILPSEKELCITHSLTRPTVRHALDELVKDGFIRKRKGKGSIVNQKPKGVGILSISGTTSALEGLDLTTRIIVKPVIRPWKEPFMFPLSDLEKESGLIYMERLRLVGNKPLFYDISYIPNLNLPRFTSRSFENKSLFDTLRKSYNIHITGGEQKLKAIKAEGEVMKYLDVEVNTPILHLERRIDTNKYLFSFYSSIYCNTQNHDLFGIF